MSSTPVRLAASISMTSGWRSSAMARQIAQSEVSPTVASAVPSGPA
jgi:hypothetical protein